MATMPGMTSDLASKIKTARLAADISQARLAQEACIPLDTLRKIEQGQTTNPKYGTVTAIIAAIRSLESDTSPAAEASRLQAAGPISGE